MKPIPLPFWLTLLPATALAEQGPPAQQALAPAAASLGQSAVTTDVGGQVIQLLFGLLLVIGLIFLLAWLARRVQQQVPAGGRNDSIQLLATRPLGPRERLLLVQVGKEQVLLGLTPGSIETLHVLQEPVEIAATETPVAGEFARRLRQVLQHNRTHDKES